jgi:hypothetical protein
VGFAVLHSCGHKRSASLLYLDVGLKLEWKKMMMIEQRFGYAYCLYRQGNNKHI